MAWRIVMQPNGEYARFSEVVDAFTRVRMSREEAVDVCRSENGMSESEAETKVWSADKDPRRWSEALAIIEAVHGPAVRASIEKEIQDGPTN